MSSTAIEWTDKVWNPTVGCTRVSEGCRNCYAFALHDMRHAAHREGKKVPEQYAKPFKELQLMPDRLDAPLHWRQPCRVFVNSMSDLFHEDVPDSFIDGVFAAMGACEDAQRGHIFQLLTKRAARMLEYMRSRGHKAWNSRRLGTEAYPPRNVWLGVSVERQQEADTRISLLLQTPAAVRFLSCEPLLGPVQFPLPCRGSVFWSGLHWVIVGGESGPNARPMHPDWARSIRDQCQAAGVPFFFKQWGEWAPQGSPHDQRHGALSLDGGYQDLPKLPRGIGRHHDHRFATVYCVGKKAAGRLLDGREWSEFPEAR